MVWAFETSAHAAVGNPHQLVIALGEYCLKVPANRIGYGMYSGCQLKIAQEAITLVVFIAFAYFYLGEPLKWNYLVSMLLLAAAVGFAFWSK